MVLICKYKWIILVLAYFLHNSGLLMEYLFKGMLYCMIFLLSKEVFNRNSKEKIKINVEVLLWIWRYLYEHTYD